MHARIVLLLPLATLLVLLAEPRGAAANMGPTVIDGDRYGALVPRGATTVRVERETLSFDLADDLASAKVRATYRMTGGAEPSSGDVAFVIASGRRGEHDHGAAIVADGAPVPFRVVHLDDGLDPAAREALVRPWSTLDPSAKLTWLVFHLDFAPRQTREVAVTYTHTPSEDRGARVVSTFGYDYLLSPAKAWASFGPIELTVRAPRDAEVTSSVPLEKTGDGLRATLPGLPAGELRLDAMSRRGLWLGMTTSGGYWAIVIVTMSLAALGAGSATGRLWHRGSRLRRAAFRVLFGGAIAAGAAALVATALAFALPVRALGYGYGGPIGVMLLIALAGPVGIAASFIAARERASRA